MYTRDTYIIIAHKVFHGIFLFFLAFRTPTKFATEQPVSRGLLLFDFSLSFDNIFLCKQSGRFLPAHKRSNAVHASSRNIILYIRRHEQKPNRVKQSRYRMRYNTLSNLGVLNCHFDFEIRRKIVRKRSYMQFICAVMMRPRVRHTKRLRHRILGEVHTGYRVCDG